MSFGEILIKKKKISNNLLVKSKEQAESEKISLEEVLMRNGVLEEDITQAKSEVFKIPVKKITPETRLPIKILQNIPEASVRHYKFMPIELKDGIIHVGVVNPDNVETRDALQFLSSKLNLPFKIFLISLSDFQLALKDFKSLGGETVRILSELESAIAEKPIPEEVKTEQRIKEEAPVIKMVAIILKHAIEENASDIHIEPLRDKLKIRSRIDGVMQVSLVLPIKIHEAIVARIKILTNMKLDEKRKPQDGRFEAKIENRSIDFRVSTFPTIFGEKIVIRVLDTFRGVKKLDELGFSGRNLETVKEVLKRPFGLVLLTGPTGSGKTTTLYSMLNLLDREKFNAVSLEDPIEYNVSGLSQSQVRPEIDYDFAGGLRSILRQDPDIIMVGEIRDKETASLAVQAALTGHLVLSTLHTNNTAGVIPRLVDMGVDPYLIPSTLVMAVAQRLVPSLCQDSRDKVKVDSALKAMLENEIKDVPSDLKEKIKIPEFIYKAKTSASCPRGNSGRLGVFEILRMTVDLEKIILTNPVETAIMEEARKQKMLTMREDGILKVLEGKIGLEELGYVT